MALGFAACDDTSDLGQMQTNPQEPVMSAGGIEVFYLPQMTGNTLDLNALKGTTINVLGYAPDVDEATGEEFVLPESAVVSFVLEVSSANDFSNVASVTLTDAGQSNYSIAADALNDAYVKVLGRAPQPQTLWFRVAGYMSDNGQLVRFGSNDTYFGLTSKTVTPVDLNLNVEQTYYLIDSKTGMNLTDGQKMTHSGKHPYDDPNFSYLLDIEDTDVANGPVEWMVVPGSQMSASGSKDLCYGVGSDDPTLMEGALVLGGVAGQITAPGKYQISVDMEKGTYRVGFANDNLYVWGGGSNYKFDNAMPLFTGDYVTYNGLAFVKTNFALFGQKNTKGLHLGASSTTEEGHLISGSKAQPITVETEGYYWFNVNLTSLTYIMKEIKTLGICGSNNNWGGDGPDAELTPNEAHTIWTGEVTFPGAGEWKVRANNDWSFSLGYEMNDLQYDSQQNLKVSEGGTYTATLDLSSYPFTITLVKK